jgi:hypothetical protein
MSTNSSGSLYDHESMTLFPKRLNVSPQKAEGVLLKSTVAEIFFEDLSP